MAFNFSPNTISKTAEIWPVRTPLTYSNRGADPEAATGLPSSDLSDVSSVPIFSKIEQLKGANPAEFQQAVVDAISQLKAAAEQNPNPFAASYLWGLINRFQFALDAASNPAGRVADSTDLLTQAS